MNVLQAIIMGLIQGLTEFLPVSSSGHLALFKNIFHVNTETGILFDVLLHVATLLAITIVYIKDIKKLFVETLKMSVPFIKNIVLLCRNVFGHESFTYHKVITTSYRKFVVMVLVSTVPTGIIGVLFKHMVERAEQALLIPGICLIITGCLLLLCEYTGEGGKLPKTAKYKDAMWIGVAQGIATLPGLSRSGTTITVCRMLGFKKSFAVKYSFIMSIPAILGAAVLELKDIGETPVSSGSMISYIIGMIVAAVVGFFALKTVVIMVNNNKFKYFSYYCFFIGFISIVSFVIERVMWIG